MEKGAMQSIKKEVCHFWTKNFLFKDELKDFRLDKEFFEGVERLKREIEMFTDHILEVDAVKGKKILDVGCGPGWYAVQYAIHGANVFALDITSIATKLASSYAGLRNVKINVLQGDAENLPFEADTFDIVHSIGVLHHTPNTEGAIEEVYRVLKDRGRCMLAFYAKGRLLSQGSFPLVISLLRLLRIVPPGKDSISKAKSVDDMIRRYDGNDNPIGKGFTKRECEKMLSRFKICCIERHYFPVRFFPVLNRMPKSIVKLLDRYLGTMFYIVAYKNP